MTMNGWHSHPKKTIETSPPPHPYIHYKQKHLKGEHYGKYITIFSHCRIGHGLTRRTDGNHEKAE
jgi:hypothetical protein